MAAMFNWFEIVVLCIMLMPTLVLGGYQIELDLRSYRNSGGRLANGACCDATFMSSLSCSPIDTCDTRLTFNVRNIHTNQMFMYQGETVGDYSNMDVINFENCGPLNPMINYGQLNPLGFYIDSDEWGPNEELQFTVEVSDVDFDPETYPDPEEKIASIVFRIPRPSAPYASFTPYQTYTGGCAQLELRYRVICRSGTCGSTCSRTTDSDPFPRACSIDPYVDCSSNPCPDGCSCETIPHYCGCPVASECSISEPHGYCRGRGCDGCFPSPPCTYDNTCSQELENETVINMYNYFRCTCPAVPQTETDDPCMDGEMTVFSGQGSTDDTYRALTGSDTCVDQASTTISTSGAPGRLHMSNNIITLITALFLTMSAYTKITMMNSI